jgi:hypothetical protein
MLGRNTSWRQGDLICNDDAISIGISECSNHQSQTIVISHDCDLASANEATVEIIVAQTIAKPNGNFISAKNPRRLHLTLINPDDTDSRLYIELCHSNRRVVEKFRFNSIQHSHSPFVLSTQEKRSLRQWLASRYARPAFPNSFENRIKKKISGGTVDNKLAKIIEPYASDLVGLFIDLGDDRYVELEEGNPYALSIVIVYDTMEGGLSARENAEKVKTQLESLFFTEFDVPECASEIALESCKAISDTSMTLADVRRMDQWRLEHISLRSEENGDLVFAGDIPP